MELRNCRVKHFIQTIRGGLVIKVCNINSNGGPVPQTKILKDIYDSEDAKRLQKSPSGSVFDNKQVKHEGSCYLVPDRTLREVKPELDYSAPSADGDSDSDLDNATTLSQLKNWLLTKKRKYVSTDEKAMEDESDLNEPLINLKPKHSKAKRTKRRCLNPSVISSAIIQVAIKSDENFVSEGSPQACGEVAPLIRVKDEVPDAEQLGSQNEMPTASSAGLNEVSNSGEKTTLPEYGREPPLIRVKDEVPDAEQLGSQNEMPTASSAGHNEVPNSGEKTVLLEYGREPLSNMNIYEECLTNEICYDHLEDVQPISMLIPGNDVSIRLDTLESDCEESRGSAPVEIAKLKEIPDSWSLVTSCYDDPNADMSCHSSSSSVVEDMPEECSSGFQVPDMAIDDCITPPQGSNCVLYEDKAETDLSSKLNDSLSSPDKDYDSNPCSITASSTEDNTIFLKDNIADEEQLSASAFDTVTRNDLNSEVHTEDELSKALDKQTSDIPITCTENEYSEDRTCANADAVSKPEQNQLPERLFSTRKAFSPSSEEQLCLVMNSVEIWDDSYQNIDSECKGKLFEIQTGKKPSSLRSEVQYDKKAVNHRLSGQVSQQKVVISPRRISKRSQIAKGNLEGPRFSRTLPNLSTGCTSVQDCSESAIAFSQRQMHDMESIAVKLMNELKSMKDIVEQKLLFEAYRNASLKNDADEVKSVISNAIRAEEMARKKMSMMARDCNRFCKIMKMTPDSPSSSKDLPLPKGGRKIMFADEAGGKLCHVKFFYDSTASPASNAIEQ